VVASKETLFGHWRNLAFTGRPNTFWETNLNTTSARKNDVKSVFGWPRPTPPCKWSAFYSFVYESITVVVRCVADLCDTLGKGTEALDAVFSSMTLWVELTW
jgi:hypothetical protein